MQLVHNPHDTFFKDSLSQVQIAKDFFKLHLPAVVAELIDFNTLQLQSGNYVDQSLKYVASDILYKVNYLHAANPAYIYILVEHQSSIDIKMPFRILRYIVSIWSDHYKNSKSDLLPLVIPLVFYNGPHNYTGPTDLRALIAAPNVLIDEFLFKPFKLIDLHQIADEVLREHYWSGLMSYVMKHAYDPEISPCMQDLLWFIGQLRAEGGTNYIISALKYSLDRARTEQPELVLAALKAGLDEDGGIMGSLAEYIANQHKDTWLQQGMQQGMRQGMQQGIQKGEITFLLHLLESKFKTIPECYKQKIEHAAPDSLLRWGALVLQSESLEQIFEHENV